MDGSNAIRQTPIVVTIGLILAGGLSSRMGQDKALLPLPATNHSQSFTSTTLLNHMQTILRQAGCADVLISGAAVGGLADRVPEAGPLAGIDSALAALKDHMQPLQLLVVPVDMPALTAGLLRDLCIAAAGERAMHYAAWMLPLVLPITPSLPETVSSLLQPESSRSIRSLLRQVDARSLPEPSDAADQFCNLNTPQEWQQWCARAAGANS